MIRTLAIENYRSLQEVTLELGQLTVVTGANGSGKSNVYRALRLLSDIVRDGALGSLAAEGGMHSALYAGKRDASRPVALRLGFATDDFSYAIDLGLPQLPAFTIPGTARLLDPEVKTEAVWHGPVLRPAALLAERRSLAVRLRDSGGVLALSDWRVREAESMLATLSSPAETPELFALRESARRWRFIDHLRTDADAPARRAGPVSFTPVLDPSGANFTGAVATVLGVGDGDRLQRAVADAFAGSQVVLDGDHHGVAQVCLTQPGLERRVSAAELSDGTLRFLLLATALLSPRPPELLVLNEPEGSLHPSLLPALATLIADAAQHTQVIVVTHAEPLVRALAPEARLIELEKTAGATSVRGQLRFEGPHWSWPKR
ncbi:AAA family ATPase [Leucobacter chromiireducens]|uniref:ATP-binding protein n=1 Tax=Leucobacter chromiireducens subsp. solipictus TaxID=398235 RepID=A0ABS1SBU9_9MICO|nr:AAA family ATPase [Leucobacter chromiireducens]MBL3678019.1 ATP-binding protein [Leucobacter chromiireducens subsp. solipictus]